LRIKSKSLAFARAASTAASTVAGIPIAGRGNEHVDVREQRANGVACDDHAPLCPHKLCRWHLCAAHDAAERLRFVERAPRPVGDERRVVLVDLGSEHGKRVDGRQ
jgi:hypothetical protein